MKTLSATDANRSFSQLLRTVVQGESVQITSRGRPVAQLSPVDARAATRRQLAKQRLLERLSAQLSPALACEDSARPVGRDWSRDELYD